MQTIEFQATIDNNGVIHIPQAYRATYGQQARFVMLLPNDQSTLDQTPTENESNNKPGRSIRDNPAFGMWAGLQGDSREFLDRLRQEQWMRP